MNLTDLIARLLAPVVTPEAVRLEIYLLGSRHRGEALAAALQELKSTGLSPARSSLLRAVVRRLQL